MLVQWGFFILHDLHLIVICVRSIAVVNISYIFLLFSDWAANISDASSKNQTRKPAVRIYLEVQNRCSKFLPKIRRVKAALEDLKPDVSKRLITILRNILNYGLFSRQNGTSAFNTNAPIVFFIHSVSNNCSNMANFPVKRLKKIRMRRIFFFLSRFNDLQLAL